MVTLVLCFFVLLYSFSSIDAQKFNAMAESLQSAINNVIPGGEPDITNRPGLITGALGEGQGDANIRTESNLSENSSRVLALVQEAVKSEHLEDEVQVRVTERGIEISLSEQILFAEGSARLLPEARRIIYKIGQVLNSLGNTLAVEGHTDSAIPENSIYGNNWGLSSARASSVVSYLNESADVAEDRLRAVGYGASSPIVPNDSEALMRLNRRVDIIVMSDYNVR
jgi:chemotaxis protein MotB